MLTDYHCHVLPGIDDGARDKATALGLLGLLHQQGVERVIATPHFYAHREASVEDFLKKRQAACDSISGESPVSELYSGAEVAIEHDISRMQGIEKLAIQGTDLILLELPYRNYETWMSKEIYNIAAGFGLTVILAHVHRYCGYYSKADMQGILETDAYFQINHDAFTSFSQRSFVKTLLREEYPVIFGSDCHNLTSRKPDWNLARKGNRAEAVKRSDSVFEKHKI